MTNEKFCLRWNDFESNISGAFRELRDDKDFFDVTLACDDDQIQAHKVILSACSPFFKNILRRNPHQNPLLYLKGVRYSDLQSVLNFMYHGEVNVAQEELNSFLSVAEDLRVKGLTQNQGGGGAKPTQNSDGNNKGPSTKANSRNHHIPAPKSDSRNSRPIQTSNHNSFNIEDEIQEVVPVKTEPREVANVNQISSVDSMPSSQSMFSPNQTTANTVAHTDDHALAYPEESYDDYSQYPDEEYQDYGAQPVPTGAIAGTEGYSFQDPSELLQFVQKDPSDLKFHCTLCSKFSHKNSSCTKNHVESQHFPNMFNYPCDKCEMSFTTKTTLNLHRTRKHKGNANRVFYE